MQGRELRIIIIGMSCSGKTTLGKSLGTVLALPVLDLDDIRWAPNWTLRSKADFDTDLQAFAAGHTNWIVSGNYINKTLPTIWPVATHIIWLNYPFATIVYRYFRRTFSRVTSREQVCGNNYETLHNALFADEPLLPYILKNYHKQRQHYGKLKQQYHPKHWIEISNARQLHGLEERFSSLET